MRKALTLTALMLLSASVSQAKTLEELLVEKGVITKGEAKMAASAPGTVVYNKGIRWDFSDKKFSGQINTMIHTRYTYTDADEDFGGKNTSSFDVTRARITASGTVLDKEFSYKLEGDFGATNDTAGARIQDAYLTWNACDWAELKMGQFKTMISRQGLANDSTLEFADRSLASDYFHEGRQVGFAANIRPADMPVTFTAAMFNGQSSTTGYTEGSNASGIDTRHNAFVAARWDAMGKMDAMEEGDIDGTEDAALNFGGAYSFAKNNVQGLTVDGTTISADANFKYQGWGIHGEYFYQNLDPKTGEKVKPQGFYAQVGYFVLPGELELAGRYSMVDCDDGAAAGICSGWDTVNQVDASANYHFWRHQLKAQLGFRYENLNALSDGSDEKINQIIFNVVGNF